MATVIPYNSQWMQMFAQSMAAMDDYFKERRYQSNLKSWQEEIDKTFGEYNKKLEGTPQDVVTQTQPTGLTQEPTGYKITPSESELARQQGFRAGYDPNAPAFNMTPTGTQTFNRPINEITRQQVQPTEEERIQLANRYRGQLESIGATNPSNRPFNPYTMIPKQELSDGSDASGGGRSGTPIPGSAMFRAFYKDSGQPIPGLVNRFRQNPGEGKYKGKEIYWDTVTETEPYYAAVAGREGKNVSNYTNFQKLWMNYLDDPIKEKEAAAMEGARALGWTPVKQDLSTKQKIQNWFGSNIPEYVFTDKNGQYIGVDNSGNAIPLKQQSKTNQPKSEKLSAGGYNYTQDEVQYDKNGRGAIKRNGKWIIVK